MYPPEMTDPIRDEVKALGLTQLTNPTWEGTLMAQQHKTKRKRRDQIVHYASFHNLVDWLRLGWVVKEPNCSNMYLDRYGTVVEWLCECPIKRPIK